MLLPKTADQHQVVLPVAARDGQKSPIEGIAEIEKFIFTEADNWLWLTAAQWLLDQG